MASKLLKVAVATPTVPKLTAAGKAKAARLKKPLNTVRTFWLQVPRDTDKIVVNIVVSDIPLKTSMQVKTGKSELEDELGP